MTYYHVISYYLRLMIVHFFAHILINCSGSRMEWGQWLGNGKKVQAVYLEVENSGNQNEFAFVWITFLGGCIIEITR